MIRSFVRSTLDVDQKTSAYKIVCRQCGKADKVACSSHSGSLPPEVTAKKFRQRGWSVGNRTGDDMCVTCVRSNMLARNATKAATATTGVVLPDLTQQAPAPEKKLLTVVEAVKTGIATQPTIYRYIESGRLPVVSQLGSPYLIKKEDLVETFKNLRRSPKPNERKPPAKQSVNEPSPLVNDGVTKMNDQPAPVPVMTKEDRRIIFSEIDSHYLDEKRGYDKDWDDEKIALGLKVMTEWVRSIREDNFGPEKGDTVDAEIEKLRAANAEAQKIIDTMRAVWKEMDATLATYEERQAELSAEATKINAAIVEAMAAIDAAINRK